MMSFNVKKKDKDNHSHGHHHDEDEIEGHLSKEKVIQKMLLYESQQEQEILNAKLNKTPETTHPHSHDHSHNHSHNHTQELDKPPCPHHHKEEKITKE